MMQTESAELPLKLLPDLRAYAVLILVFSPIYILWILASLRRGGGMQVPFLLVTGLLVFGLLYLHNKSVRIGDLELVQGWPPFRTTIPYHEIARIHHVFVSNRYASVACLAISSRGETRRILLPLRSFGIEKRRSLVDLLRTRAPQARADVSG